MADELLQATAERLGLMRVQRGFPVPRRAIRSGHFRRVRAGVLCTDPTRGSTLVEAVAAALLVAPAGAVACGLTAARLWNVGQLPPPALDEQIELMLPGPHRRLAGCVIRRGTPACVAWPEGIPATSLAETLVDLCGRLDFATAFVAVEAALHADPDLHDRLVRDIARRGRAWRGCRRASSVVSFGSTLSESPLESQARLLWRAAGLPTPIQQAVIRSRGRFLARVDFLWPEAMLVVEVDGLGKYDDRGELSREKQRQNALVAAGYVVLRFTWADIVRRPESTAAAVRQIVSR